MLEVVRGTSVAHGRADDILGCDTSFELCLDDANGRVLLSSSFVTTEILGNNICTEARSSRIRNGSESRARSPSCRLQGDHKGTVTSHGVSHNGSSVGINWEEICNKTREFFSYVREHVEVFAVGFGSSVAVVSSSITDFVIRVVVDFSVVKATRRSVREDNRDIVFFSVLGESRFLSSIVLCARKSR